MWMKIVVADVANQEGLIEVLKYGSGLTDKLLDHIEALQKGQNDSTSAMRTP